ncbi:MAG TPA: PIN domain-containing protein, partial [Burkholderiales bacterium]|nr:PIN domain-containing protein [Burkholderiales bacterium]
MKTDFVLIDFENVQPKDVASLNGGRYKIKVFLGAQQAKVPLAMARALQALGQGAEYIQINGNGHNAVDFHIAYYIGRLAATAPHSQFYVISQDTGFDPLLK